MQKRSIEKIALAKDNRNFFRLPNNNENTAAIVTLKNGNRYVASFFAFNSIEELRTKNATRNEFLGGKYFWEKGMLLIDDCSIENIRLVIEDIIDEGNFEEIFQQIS